VMIDVVPEDHMNAAKHVKEVVSTYREAEDLINIGAYAKGSNPKIDFAISANENINTFLQQGIYEKASFDETRTNLLNLL